MNPSIPVKVTNTRIIPSRRERKDVNRMRSYLCKTLEIPFDEAIYRASDKLKNEWFGILTGIDEWETSKNQLNVGLKKTGFLVHVINLLPTKR